MENFDERITALMNKDEWTDEEKQWLLNYFEVSDGVELRSFLEKHFNEEKSQSRFLDGGISDKVLQNVHERIGAKMTVSRASIVRMWALRIAAASVLAFLVFTAYLNLRPTRVQENILSEESKKPAPDLVVPGGNKALLTLADGSTIVLDDQQNGFLTQQGNTKVIKINGKLVYDVASANTGEVSYNTITTPAGGQFQIELADGSLVWLNAGSSLHFPTTFAGKERRVEIKGEAYFEVEKNTLMPFVVKVKDAEVRVLGTSFNIMAYDDEDAMKTTLLEGAVQFVHGSNSSSLKPGQQTQLNRNGKVKVLNRVDVDGVVAWKNGMFDFDGTDLLTVARQLSRWYNVEMILDQKNDDLFYAKIPRHTNLKDVLKALELTGKIRFTIQGRVIKVKAIS